MTTGLSGKAVFNNLPQRFTHLTPRVVLQERDGERSVVMSMERNFRIAIGIVIYLHADYFFLPQNLQDVVQGFVLVNTHVESLVNTAYVANSLVYVLLLDKDI